MSTRDVNFNTHCRILGTIDEIESFSKKKKERFCLRVALHIELSEGVTLEHLQSPARNTRKHTVSLHTSILRILHRLLRQRRTPASRLPFLLLATPSLRPIRLVLPLPLILGCNGLLIPTTNNIAVVI